MEVLPPGHPQLVEPIPLLLREPLDGSPLREVGVDLEAQGVDYAQVRVGLAVAAL